MADFAFTPGAVIPLLKETAEGFQEHLLDIREVLLAAMNTTRLSHDSLLVMIADGGPVELSNTPLPNGLQMGQVTEWSSALEFLYQSGLAAGEAAAEGLLEASKGDRHVIYTPLSPNWEIQALASDPFRIVVSPDGVPMLLTPSGGMYVPSTLQGVSTLGVTGVEEVVMVVVAVGAYALVAYFGIQAIITAFHSLDNAINAAREAYLMRSMYECLKTSSPEVCQKSAEVAAKAHESVLDAETRQIKARNEALENQNKALWAFAAIGVVGVLGYGAYKYNK